ncbi:MAG: hypothetical protein ABIA12_00795 [Candidatus Aenigmatarchaeota archaeon]
MAFKNKRWLLLISLAAFVSFLLNLYLSASFEFPGRFDARIPPLGNQSGLAANKSGLDDNQSRLFEPSWPFDPFFRGRLGIPVHSMFLSSALLIASVVPASYYLLSESLEHKLEMKFNVISKLVKGGRSASKSAPRMDDNGIVLKFLNPNERKVVGALIGKKRDVLQSEISRMGGMDKLKTHRAIKDLERKGIIVREGYGKTNRVMLTEDVRKLFK